MTLFSRLYNLANLCENKVLADRKCFTVHSYGMSNVAIFDLSYLYCIISYAYCIISYLYCIISYLYCIFSYLYCIIFICIV